MKTTQQSAAAVVNAMHNLMEIRASQTPDLRVQYALAWMVGAKMFQQGLLPAEQGLRALTTRHQWSTTVPQLQVGDICAGTIWKPGTDETAEKSLETFRAIAILEDMMSRAPDFDLWVPDALWYTYSGGDAGLNTLAPEACDLLYGLVGAPKGAQIWIPFDASGQLAVRAKRLGLQADLASPVRLEPAAQMMRAIVGNFEPVRSEDAVAVLNSLDTEDHDAEYVLAVPPTGGWQEWHSEGVSRLRPPPLRVVQRFGKPLTLDRPETWTIAALWPKTRKRAVFMVPPTVLFARGQEHRLREMWIRDRYPIETIATLPTRIYSQTNIAPAVLVFDVDSERDTVRMADLDNLEIRVSTKTRGRYYKALDIKRAVEILGIEDPFLFYRNNDSGIGVTPFRIDTPTVREIKYSEIADSDSNLLPVRYLTPKPTLIGNRVRLRDLVQVIRAPIPIDDPTSPSAIEIGIPELGVWRQIVPKVDDSDVTTRTVRVRERRLPDATLRVGDIVMSIKGTVGKTAIIGRTASLDEANHDGTLPMVVSGNCIALRPVRADISPEYLLLYFRSTDFAMQRSVLLVGAVIPHVTPDDLLDAVRVPIPTAEEAAQLMETYRNLCDLEAQADAANKRITEIVNKLWQIVL